MNLNLFFWITLTRLRVLQFLAQFDELLLLPLGILLKLLLEFQQLLEKEEKKGGGESGD